VTTNDAGLQLFVFDNIGHVYWFDRESLSFLGEQWSNCDGAPLRPVFDVARRVGAGSALRYPAQR
jgi:hypothetical protein